MRVVLVVLAILAAVVVSDSGRGGGGGGDSGREVTVSARTSTVEVPGEVIVGEKSRFIITARDEMGHPVRSGRGGISWSVRLIGPVYVSPDCVVEVEMEVEEGSGGGDSSSSSSGLYSVEFVLPQAGEYRVQVELKYRYIGTGIDIGMISNSSSSHSEGYNGSGSGSGGRGSNRTSGSGSSCTRSKVFRMYTACNPKSDYYVNVDGLGGCSEDLGSEACLASTKKYIECMDHVKDVCQFPHLVKERLPIEPVIHAIGFEKSAVTPSTARPCVTRAAALGRGHWVNVSQTCSMWMSLGFTSETACQDAVYPCSTEGRRSHNRIGGRGDKLSKAICSSTLIWRPNSCYLKPMPKRELESPHRSFYFYGVSTMDEIARRMRDFFEPDSIISLRNLHNSAEIPWLKRNTTFVLHGCGEQVATTLTLTLFDKQRHHSCVLFTRNIRNIIKRHSLAYSNFSIDIVYQRHPVNYPRNARTPSEIKSAIGRYPGSRGYMSADELLTDFYYDIMATYANENVPITGILNQQSMTAALWSDYGDGLHYDNDALRFVLDQCVLLLANVAVMPTKPAPPIVHDNLLGSCPSYVRSRGFY